LMMTCRVIAKPTPLLTTELLPDLGSLTLPDRSVQVVLNDW
jgi:hypothetical protein